MNNVEASEITGDSPIFIAEYLLDLPLMKILQYYQRSQMMQFFYNFINKLENRKENRGSI
ncbi:MAG: hypothetical protein HZB73_01080 [Nitrosarchaeum sp.]|nr:hypothetical protein [Nitrosarchaeum sp.]